MKKNISLTRKRFLSLISRLAAQPTISKKSRTFKAILQCQKSLDKLMKRKILVLLKDKNFGNGLIHEITEVSRSYINRMYKTWKNTPSLLDAGRTGRPPKLDKEQRKELNKLIEENKDASSTILKKLWGNTCRLSLYYN